MKKYLIALLAIFGLGQVAFIPSAIAQNPRVTIPDFADLVERASPAVVNIRTTEKVVVQQAQGGIPGMPEDQAEFFRRFFGVPIPGIPNSPKQAQPNPGKPQEADRGVGSGFIIESNGLILTNAHVVEGATTIYVTLTDKREFKAKLLGMDKRTDVAVVKIEARDLPKLPLGDSSRVRVGEWVLAIGSPFGLENTVTAGIVSAKSRDTGDYLPFIQTDVAVNPGNSGGPLLNTAGQVIGINSQIFSRSGGYMGISFAIPIDEAMRVADQLRTNGKMTRGRIGVALGEMTKEVAESLGLGKPRGAYVRNVEPGGPAAAGGIEAGDVILSFNGRDISKSTDLPRVVGETKPGTSAPLQVWRKGGVRDLTVTVTDTESGQVANKRPDTPAASGNGANTLGVVVSELSDAKKKDLNIKGGVEVTGLGDGPLAKAGIRPGDVIIRVADADITSVKQFEALAKGLDVNKAVPVFIRRADSTLVVPVRPK
ncbi:DegQ family serine endoprotease [Polynucleobacter sp. AP-Reno-20A-A9]|uniref:DegQ family serine endoprotease n=1 Tax=Polynucleobacter sp. AP-Reno-20A-A9 TaxID=2576925 RepID=UPI001C0CD79F|nr:DegQ family serine endoprotease [Polynucleobacter sp. AP-Reno-20A-A9]MBU3628985.1 DegQ family serine endoprotease [Polynucleobacter sp. AP-Reno-20A-A9]